MSMREIIATIICNIIFCLMIGIFGWGLGYDRRRKEQDESALEHAHELVRQHRIGFELGKRVVLHQLVHRGLLTAEQAKEVMQDAGP